MKTSKFIILSFIILACNNSNIPKENKIINKPEVKPIMTLTDSVFSDFKNCISDTNNVKIIYNHEYLDLGDTDSSKDYIIKETTEINRYYKVKNIMDSLPNLDKYLKNELRLTLIEDYDIFFICNHDTLAYVWWQGYPMYDTVMNDMLKNIHKLSDKTTKKIH